VERESGISNQLASTAVPSCSRIGIFLSGRLRLRVRSHHAGLDDTSGCQHDLHSLVEHLSNALPSQRTAFHISALELLPDVLLQIFLIQEVLVGRFGRVSEVYLATHEEDVGGRHFLLDFGDPLREDGGTFFLAFLKESGSTTEKAMRKMSVLG
jgi:hypothetical protein